MGDVDLRRDRPCVTIVLRFLATIPSSLLATGRRAPPLEAPSIPFGRGLGPLGGDGSRTLVGAIATPRA